MLGNAHPCTAMYTYIYPCHTQVIFAVCVKILWQIPCPYFVDDGSLKASISPQNLLCNRNLKLKKYSRGGYFCHNKEITKIHHWKKKTGKFDFPLSCLVKPKFMNTFWIKKIWILLHVIFNPGTNLAWDKQKYDSSFKSRNIKSMWNFFLQYKHDKNAFNAPVSFCTCPCFVSCVMLFFCCST